MNEDEYAELQDDSCSSYAEYLEDIISLIDSEPEGFPDFKWENAFESLTERGSIFRRVSCKI